MTSTPLISIVIPHVGDEAPLMATLQSCADQTGAGLEIICVAEQTDADAVSRSPFRSTVRVVADSTTDVSDMRRRGSESARGQYTLFLEAGDRLDPDAVGALATGLDESEVDVAELAIIDESGHDIDARTPTRASRARTIETAEDILRHRFPADVAVKPRLWGLLWRTDLLQRAYREHRESVLPSLDDGPLALLLFASAARYAIVPAAQYRRRRAHSSVLSNASGAGASIERVRAMSSAQLAVRALSRRSRNPEPLLDAYASVRLSSVSEALMEITAAPSETRSAQTGELLAHVSEVEVISAAVTFAPELVPFLISHGKRAELGQSPVRSVLLTTNVITTGGVSGVLLTQARLLLAAGYRVTVAAHRAGSALTLVPEGAAFVELTASSKRERLVQWSQFCRAHAVDLVIDHRILYSRDWPGFALTARASGAATVGWIHNFAGRPTYNGNDLHSLLSSHLDALAHLIVLSPLDVAFWKLRGIRRVSYLPNPPSPFLLDVGAATSPKAAPAGRPAQLIWWGRLEEHTKKVSQLVEVAAALKRLGVDFRLRIVGPEWGDMTTSRLADLADQRGVADEVEVVGPRHGPDLLAEIDAADVFVNTSIIEGYPLTIPEAQSRALPIAMYDMPWLSLTRDNAGVITAPQQDPEALALALAELLGDAERYEAASRASISAAARATAHDFADLYERLVTGTLPEEYSPEPTVDYARRSLDLLIFFAEHSTPPAPGAGRRGRGRLTRRRRAQPATPRARIERRLTPIGHQVLDVAPWLRPAARAVKHMLLRK